MWPSPPGYVWDGTGPWAWPRPGECWSRESVSMLSNDSTGDNYLPSSIFNSGKILSTYTYFSSTGTSFGCHSSAENWSASLAAGSSRDFVSDAM
jgi:hypothetical protein